MKPGWSLAKKPKDVLVTLGILAARDQALEKAAIDLQSDWIQQLNQPGSGKTYEAGTGFITHKGRVIPVKARGKFRGRRSTHVASAPGESPAKDTGDLQRAVQVVRSGAGYLVGMGGEIGRRGLALEYGVGTAGSQVGPHPGGIVIEPRPHARPAFRRWQRTGPDRFRAGLKHGTKGPTLG